MKLAKVKEEKAKAGHESNRLSALIVQSPERMKTEIASMKTQLTQVRLEITSIKTQLRSGRLSYVYSRLVACSKLNDVHAHVFMILLIITDALLRTVAARVDG